MNVKLFKKNGSLTLIELNDSFIIYSDRSYNKITSKEYKYWTYFGDKVFNIVDEHGNKEKKQSEVIMINKENSLNIEHVNNIFNIMCITINTAKEGFLAECLEVIESYFRNFYSTMTTEKLQGLFAEFLFIYDVQKRGYEVQDYYHKDDKSDLDFYFVNSNKYGELKSCLSDSNDFVISHKQLSYDPSNTFFITVNLWPDENGINIVELFELINFTNPTLVEKVNYYKNFFKTDLFVKETKYNIQNYSINIFEGAKLPSLKVVGNDTYRIKNIKYNLNTDGIQSIDFSQFIEQI